MTDNIRENFSKNLKYIMRKKNVSQFDIVKNLDLPPATVSSWVNGTRLPRMSKLRMLSDFFDVSVNELLDENPRANIDMGYSPVMKILEHDEYTYISTYLKELNAEGKKEAVKRVEELTYIPKYTEPDNENK